MVVVVAPAGLGAVQRGVELAERLEQGRGGSGRGLGGADGRGPAQGRVDLVERLGEVQDARGQRARRRRGGGGRGRGGARGACGRCRRRRRRSALPLDRLGDFGERLGEVDERLSQRRGAGRGGRGRRAQRRGAGRGGRAGGVALQRGEEAQEVVVEGGRRRHRARELAVAGSGGPGRPEGRTCRPVAGRICRARLQRSFQVLQRLQSRIR